MLFGKDYENEQITNDVVEY